AFRFRLSGSTDNVTAMRATMEELAARVETLEIEFSEDGAFAELLHVMAEDVAAYRFAFDALVDANTRQATLVGDMTLAGEAAEGTIVLALETSAAFGAAATTAKLSRLQRDMYRATVFMERFLLSESNVAFEDAKKAVGLAMDDIAKFDVNQLPGPAQTSLVESSEHLTRYWALAEEIAANTVLSQELRSTLDSIGPKLAEDIRLLVATAAEKQTSLGVKSTATSRLALLLILVMAGVALGTSMWLSRRISSGITDNIQSSIDEMAVVASGDLSVEISNTEAQTEIGEMARALEVFRDKAAQARALELQQKEEEKKKARLETERAEQEQVAERKRQEQAAADRQAMIATLQDAMGSVVDAAASGDFTLRVDAQFDDQAFRDMAGSVNLLLDNVEQGLNQTLRVMTTLSDGDLTDRFDGEFNGVFQALQTSVNGTIETLSDIVLEITAKCESVGTQAGLMSNQSTSLAERAEKQAASLEETSAAMDQMAASASSSAQGASEAAVVATQASKKVEDAGTVVVAAVDAMSDIKDASDRIGEIVSVIEGIAFQTNLLALNASVEAARAGSAGKGFAVVASEVRALAQRSSEASQDIKSLIEESAGQVDRGVDMVQNTGETLKEIVTSVKTMADAMDKLTTAAREQSTGVHEVTGAISELDVITQKNASLAETSRESSSLLRIEAEAMQAIVGRFRTGNATSTAFAAE
ncbi:MAG: methyl-accepting chemotaxis protein, partial [Pseudomonadota bacterium]